MSDVPEGPGWWRASDGRWYPPQDGPAAAPPSWVHEAPTTPSVPPAPGAPPVPTPAAPGVPPVPTPPAAPGVPLVPTPPGAPGVPPSGFQPGGAPAAPGYGTGGHPAPPGGYGPGGSPVPPGYGPGGYPVPPAPRPSQGMHGCLVAFLVVLAVGAVLGVGSCVLLVVAVDEASDEIATDLAEGNADERDDVADPRCSADAVGTMQAVMDVTNDSTERSSYSIEVAFESPDGDQITTGLAGVSALEPGQSTVATASTATDAPADFTCRVVDVQRFSDQP